MDQVLRLTVFIAIPLTSPIDCCRRTFDATTFIMFTPPSACVNARSPGLDPGLPGPAPLVHGFLSSSPIALPGLTRSVRRRFGESLPAWYVCDTVGDLHEARAAGAGTVGVVRGWRREERLPAPGHDRIARCPSDLLDLFWVAPPLVLGWRAKRTAMRSAADRLDVGWPDPTAEVLRMPSESSCRASSRMASRSARGARWLGGTLVAGLLVLVRRPRTDPML
jgi:hypothetical protein